jgi:isocitrate/isopropylmalate dehydrogenase
LRPLASIDGSIDVLLVRENIEDLYGAIEWWAAPGIAQAVKIATADGCRRVSRFAYEQARAKSRRRITIVHKANNLKLTEGLFLDEARAMAESYPDLEVDDMLADTAASTLILDPHRLDVILTSNTFGDLLSNVGSAVAGSLGLGACINHSDAIVLAEPSHGSSTPPHGATNTNPIGMIRAAGLLLESLHLQQAAQVLDRAIARATQAGAKTPDLGGQATTDDVVTELCRSIRQIIRATDPEVAR